MLVISRPPGLSITLPYDTTQMVGYSALSLMETSRAMLPIPRLTTIAFNRHIRQQKGKRWAELGQACRFPAKRRLDKQRVYFLHLASKPGVVAPESEMKSPSMTLSAGMNEERRGGVCQDVTH